MIVACALQYATQGIEVTVIADDTDILILLIYHWQKEMVFIGNEVTKETLEAERCFFTKLVKHYHHTFSLFMHGAVVNTTFGQGKTTLLKKIKESQNSADIMNDPNAMKEEIGSAGIRLFVHLYGHKQTDSLRYAKFMEMASYGKTLEPERLPSTERAAFFHSLRVHHQVILWRELSNKELDPLQWGWKLDGKILMPIMTDLDPAPDNMLKFIQCKCKVSSRNPCGTNVCSCRKNGLKCVPACGDCRGETYNNSEQIITDQEENLDSDENEDIIKKKSLNIFF